MQVTRSGDNIRILIDYTDFTAAAANETLTVSGAIPKGHLAQNCVMMVNTDFDGTNPTIGVFDVDDTGTYMTDQAVDVVANFYQPVLLGSGDVTTGVQMAATQFSRTTDLDIHVFGAVTAGQVDGFTQGQVEIIVNLLEIAQ